MRAHLMCFAAFLAASTFSAFADDEEIFKAAYAQGYDAGFAAGSKVIGTEWGTGTVAVQPGTVLVPGTQFDTIIGPGASFSDFKLSPDSSIAIIPNTALKDLEQKLGDNYLQDKNIILNNNAAGFTNN